MIQKFRRWGILLVVSILLGLSEGGLIAYTLLYKYGTLPIRTVLAAAPIVGVVLYWWANTLEELLSMISALTIVAGVSTIVAYSTPLFVLPDPSVAEQNVLLLDALNRTFLHLGLSTVLVVFGALATAIAYREALLPDSWLEQRGRPNAGIALVTVAIVLVAGTLAVPMLQNYASAVGQQDVEASVDRICYLPSEDTIYVSIAVPNNMGGQLWIDSYLFEVTWGEDGRVAPRGFPDEPIPPRETGYVNAWATIDENVSEPIATPTRVEISGFIYTYAFNDYAIRIDVPPTDVTVRECGNDTVPNESVVETESLERPVRDSQDRTPAGETSENVRPATRQPIVDRRSTPSAVFDRRLAVPIVGRTG
jgi:hypothetical protein